MDYQKEILKNKRFGGTIRLGAWPCELQPKTQLKEIYSKYKNDLFKKGKVVQERHRHRYEFNNEYGEQFINSGFKLSGLSPDKTLVEAMELPKDVHPFFIGTQYHPELKSQFLILILFSWDL
jgi:CTP synthase